jgi:unsaturated chondroitin disaccharide hydrolase
MNYKEYVEKNKEWIDEVWDKIDKKMKVVAPTAKDKIPYTTDENGIFDNCAGGNNGYHNISWWTNGFWPGYMWLLYVGTGDAMYREVAENAEKILDAAFENYDGLHHDVGFMWHISAGVNYRLTGNRKSRLRALYAADFLAARFNPIGGYIRSWNNDADSDGYNKLIIDSMMNIPLLYWAAEEHKDDRYKEIAKTHADTAMRTHIRPDGTSHHIVEMNPKTGEIVCALGGQGYELSSTWTRGQAWAIYGFVLSYIHTGDQKYFDTAKKVANAFIACAAQQDWIVPLDFRQPDEPKYYDSTAAACAACGLIEIAKNCSEYDQKNYINAAIKLLKALDEKAADYGTEKQNLLNYGSEAYFADEKGLNTAIIYGDYFYTEAFYKLKGFEPLFW